MRPVAFNTWRAGNRSRVHGKWIGYRNSGGGWDAIDAAFRDDGSRFVSDHGPFRFQVPLFAHQTAILEITNAFDIFAKSTITAPAMVFEVTPENVSPYVTGRIDENNPTQVWYDDAWGPGLSLRYTVWHGRAPRATREAVIDPTRCPRGRDLTASWLVRAPRALTLINGARPKNPDGSDWTGAAGDTAELPETGAAIHYFDGQVDPVRGSGFKGPQVWYWKQDGDLVTGAAKVTATIVDAETIRLTKTIEAETIDKAAIEGSLVFCDDTQTIYPDPHAEVTTFDGYLGVRNNDFVTALTAASSSGSYSNDNQTTMGMGWYNPGTGTRLNRTMCLFDVSALAGNTVSAATQAVYAHGNLTGNYHRVTGATTAINTGWTAADYGDTYTNHDDSYNVADVQGTPAGYMIIDHNATGLAAIQSAVDGSGIFKTCWRQQEDYQGSISATANGGFMVRSAEYSGTSSDPYLEVTYGAAAGGGTDPTARRRRMLRMLCSCDSRKG